MSKIKNAFTNGKAFIAFITCGDPDLETTKEAVIAAVNGGADLIELGIPFSDPTAEGPVIQGANLRALSGGVTTDKIFDFVVDLRKSVSVPMVFMTYANVVFSYGSEEFIKRCNEIGMDGLILPDLPFEEKEEFEEVCNKYDVDLVSLIAPTSEKRISMIAKEAKGFIYVVSSLGVTGTRSSITTDLDSIVKLIRESSDVPCAIGFGISTPEQASKYSKIADGVIVGSAIIKLLEKHGKDAPKYVEEYVHSMKAAM
ncbi:MAG: tryptophan synthase subunit alpha [Butyrivibrio sp.]|uniref:tryptophan synthase subunit alpha n=1 Tax=Butyrivibrio sp. TaxID=28121 RepID=UPI0025C078A0|nr:tryptophan synthase subunit alpha [Butyrivibrio sp.]MBQ6589302.1 tryptophan synthase subunit alpha [Butyrivibrio sp.]